MRDRGSLRSLSHPDCQAAPLPLWQSEGSDWRLKAYCAGLERAVADLSIQCATHILTATTEALGRVPAAARLVEVSEGGLRCRVSAAALDFEVRAATLSG